MRLQSGARCRKLILAVALGLVVAGCGSAGAGNGGDAGAEGSGETLTVGAIPDQNPQELQRRYGKFARYLSDKLGVDVRYEPVTDYTAAVTAFRRGDLDLVFFGGLTGVQATLQVPGAEPIAQRAMDANFHSVFIANTDTHIAPINRVAGLDALAGHSFTFGSKVSTSGRLMPQYFLAQAGVHLDDFAGQVGFSGSHDKTIKLVEAGTYEAGALNEAVWKDRKKAGQIDTSKVRVVFRTPPYHDYHWVIGPQADERFGKGFTQRVTDALLALDGSSTREREILDLFQAEKFIPTSPDNYQCIEKVARRIGLVQ